MAMDLDDIAEALELDYEKNKAVVDMMKERIDARLGTLKLTPMQRLQTESMVKDELAAWQSEMMYGDATVPKTTEGWRDGVDACLAKAETRLESSLKLRAEMEASNLEAYDAREEQYQKEAARMDRDADIRLEEYSEELPPKVVGHADMDEVAVARLGKNDAVATSALASCTGVSLYDPKTGVGAVMHVYQGKITIQDALEAMQTMDAGIKASELQVTLMPGSAKGVNMSHLESLHDQLSEAGITQVRDFSKEGRTSSTLLLRGDGVVISTTEAEKLAMAPTGVGSAGARARSDSVDSTSSVEVPLRTPENLPPMPDSPRPDTPDVPDAPTRARSASVGAVLGLGKYKQGGSSEGLGEDGPSTGSKLKRSSSESQLGGGRRM
ncbi:hypothetical protein DES53_103108 [Roseimicrobium gellanilyticum]|uniref:Uncharacterized protein n=1 Tax=Roseimicrobium gellanilyticum TaxID=748857 RepID=A0A366HP18_9BACT|nr:hypothetical protein [Roseimicrobium gellanilyticum]RBP45111.1 hypothetical protein DES53_103108 [Roseimicrobium gellanilyticum]